MFFVLLSLAIPANNFPPSGAVNPETCRSIAVSLELEAIMVQSIKTVQRRSRDAKREGGKLRGRPTDRRMGWHIHN